LPALQAVFCSSPARSLADDGATIEAQVYFPKESGARAFHQEDGLESPAPTSRMKSRPMKKLFAIAILSMFGLAMETQQAGAWGCGPCGYVEGHQYNAFSPYCIDGTRFKHCNCCHRCCFLPVWNAPPPCCCPDSGCGCDGMACGPQGCGGPGELPPADSAAPGKTPANTTPDKPNFNAPMPTPSDGSRSMAPPGTMPVGPAANPALQPTGFRPIYYPGYYGYGSTGYGSMPAYGTPQAGMAPDYGMPQAPGY
jgi:hypothetical protein